MPTTPHLGLFVVEPTDTTTPVLDWVRSMSSTDPTSNMMIIDRFIAEKANKVIESQTEPDTVLNAGDEWDELLSEEEMTL